MGPWPGRAEVGGSLTFDRSTQKHELEYDVSFVAALRDDDPDDSTVKVTMHGNNEAISMCQGAIEKAYGNLPKLF